MLKCDEKLTVEKLKMFKGFEEISDELASEIIDQLKEFCLIILESNNTSK